MALILNLGCGRMIHPERVNVDSHDHPGVDVVADLDTFPWPWADGTVDEVHALHIFEHVEHPVEFMAECWRILAPGGLLHIVVPHWQSPNAFTDPTHRRYCTEDTFRYWVRGTWLHDVAGEMYAGHATFLERRCERIAHDLVVELVKEDPCATS